MFKNLSSIDFDKYILTEENKLSTDYSKQHEFQSWQKN